MRTSGIPLGGIMFEMRTTKELDMSQTIEHLDYSVPGLSCEHCRAAVSAEVARLPGVAEVDVDLDAKRVHVAGAGLKDAKVRAAIEEAGYDVV
jgi:copper chaperone